jgi:hypothetical protein
MNIWKVTVRYCIGDNDMKLHIYHHNDFDGIASAAIFAKFLQIENDCDFNDIVFHQVDYDLKNKWLEMTLQKPCAVLDYLYHPESDWWFDHHAAPFLTHKKVIEHPYEDTLTTRWNPKALSCPSLFLSHLYHPFRKHYYFLQKQYSELIKWSDIIDGAKYKSPSDIYDRTNNYLNINKTLALCHCDEYVKLIIKASFYNDLSILIETAQYKDLLNNVIEQEEKAIEIISKIIKVENQVAFFDQSPYDFPFQRYLVYHLYPNIYYRIGIFKKKDSYSISINYNNWKKDNNSKDEINKINLGKLCKKYGGGGRFNVGGILKQTHQEALNIAGQLFFLFRESYYRQGLLFD